MVQDFNSKYAYFTNKKRVVITLRENTAESSHAHYWVHQIGVKGRVKKKWGK